ncbi:mitochondrial inner membrane protease ATP23 isoform X2 [Syzygium oleosum]|uniref:mitochondrial inner membrane protease ATP23 isoform X2 n=1 Tax=Syzygium oleosum TaxID=219896 RepID=UPI0024BA56E1|nr:mitochondrial inner membrane protease ATP23 isoform X2 [Syzygium oleosum]
MVRFLKEQLEKAGCALGDNFIKAVNCDGKVSGGYMPGLGVYEFELPAYIIGNEVDPCIVVCSNHMELQDDVNQVVIHELIHAYDECRAANLDWSNCAHHACSEIRAGHLSGDCHYKRELLRGYMKIRGHEQECVRRRVMKSVTANPHCSEAAAKDAMEAVWDVCYNDTKPFDRAP